MSRHRWVHLGDRLLGLHDVTLGDLLVGCLCSSWAVTWVAGVAVRGGLPDHFLPRLVVTGLAMLPAVVTHRVLVRRVGRRPTAALWGALGAAGAALNATLTFGPPGPAAPVSPWLAYVGATFVGALIGLGFSAYGDRYVLGLGDAAGRCPTPTPSSRSHLARAGWARRRSRCRVSSRCCS